MRDLQPPKARGYFLFILPVCGQCASSYSVSRSNHSSFIFRTTRNDVMASEVAQLPQIELFHRVMGLPVVESALAKSASTYSKVKDMHQLVHWAFTTAETSLSNATKQAMPIAAPIAKRFENSIHFVDHTLCKGLDTLEAKVPMVKERSELILTNAYGLAVVMVMVPAASTINYVTNTLSLHAASVKTMTWNKANDILSTQLGVAALNGLGSTAAIADKLIDQFFPAENAEEDTVPISAEDDKLLHTVQTVGRLSNKAARRVFGSVRQHLKSINSDDLKEYVGHLVTILHLTQYLHAINDKVQAMTSTKKQDKATENVAQENIGENETSEQHVA